MEFPYGKLIDQFESVVRLNKFRTKGYEEWVGSKTTHVIGNKYVIADYNSTNEELRKKYLRQNKGYLKETYDWCKAQNLSIEDTKDELASFKHNNLFVPELREPKATFLTIGPTVHSTGFYAIEYFVKQGIVPTIVGFDFFQKTSCYWQNTSRAYDETRLISDRTSNFTDSHPYKQEQMMVKRMLITNKLKILQYPNHC